MLLTENDNRALWVTRMAHRFIYEHGIRWLPVNPEDAIGQHENWTMKYVAQVAQETGLTEEAILKNVMQSDDGVTMYNVDEDRYDILINAADGISPGRIRWTKIHELGHIYLGHLEKNERTVIGKNELSDAEYDQLEFEADLFASEVLASKWLMRYLGIQNEYEIAMICGLSDKAAQSRYRKATEDYSYTPLDATMLIHHFADYCKMVTVCRDKEDMEFPEFAVENNPRRKYAKAKAPFLRKPMECPYCGGLYNNDAAFCPGCGSMIKAGAERGQEHCWAIQPEGAAFCEQCGLPVYQIRQGFCMEECEV